MQDEETDNQDPAAAKVSADAEVEDSGESSDSSSEPASEAPSSRRHVAHGVTRVEHDTPSWPVTDSDQDKLKQFWNKFKVSKSAHMNMDNDDHGNDGHAHDDDETSSMETSSPRPAVPEVDDSPMPSVVRRDSHDLEASSADKDSGSESSSEREPCSSKGPDVDMSKDIPLCVKHAPPFDIRHCPGEECEICFKIREDLSNGLDRCYAPTLSPSWSLNLSDSDDEDVNLGDGTEEFKEAMVKSSWAEHTRAMKSMDASTMHTPECPQPGFFGFPVVPTPPKLCKPVPYLNCR